MDGDEKNVPPAEHIEVTSFGPYIVHGGIPLVSKTQIVSEYGEPLTWKTEKMEQVPSPYRLCRCGHSSARPHCDNTHRRQEFDKAETADTRPTAERQRRYEGTGIIVKRDASLCSHSGFCGNRQTNVPKMVASCDDTQVRALAMAMIEKCPSGSYTYALGPDEADVEPDLPRQVAATTEITAAGPIAGPLWVTGNIPIVRADGQPFETRNRVTLCCCGRSHNKPLCDGQHRLPEE